MRDGFSTASVDASEPPVLVAPAICGTEFGETGAASGFVMLDCLDRMMRGATRQVLPA